MLNPGILQSMNVAHWMPVDCKPLSVMDKQILTTGKGQPIALSMHGKQELEAEGFHPLYVPHSVDTSVFKPADRDAIRAEVSLQDRFIVGINAANLDACRKGFSEQFAAFREFHRKHDDAILLVHSRANTVNGADLNLMARRRGIADAVMFADQVELFAGRLTSDHMARWYSILDVLSNCSYGEGFGLPVLEAQACGTPVVVTNWSSMPELCGAGWMTEGQPWWNVRHSADWLAPSIPSIVDAYERAYEEAHTLRAQARAFALQFDATRVLMDCWKPALEKLAERQGVLAASQPAKKKAGRRVWSPVMFKDELDMLRVRLTETAGLVDQHVIVEAPVTHRGVPKPLHYHDNVAQFARWQQSIMYVPADIPVENDPWVAEHAQRDAAFSVMQGAADDDIVLITDLDELPSRELVEQARAGQLPDPCAVMMRTFLYAVDWEAADQEALPPTCVVASAGYIRRNGGSLAAIRDRRSEYPVVRDGGWHFSWLGGPEAQKRKLETATCHTELLGTAEGNRIADGTRYREAADGDGVRTVPVDVDSSWPAEIWQRRVPAEWFRPRPASSLSDFVVMTTAWRRPYYLEKTLAAWERARGLSQIRKFAICLGASPRMGEARKIVEAFAKRVSVPVEVYKDDGTLGPWRTLAQGGNRVFEDEGAGFLVIAEEDILVGDDVLELLAWGRETFEDTSDVLVVNAHSRCGQGWDGPGVRDDPNADPAVVRLLPYFNQWGWGTWRDRWEKVLIPDWDYDGTSGAPAQSGHDWNIHLRTMRGYVAVVPDASRTQHIGDREAWAATAETLAWSKAASFRRHRDPVEFRVAE